MNTPIFLLPLFASTGLLIGTSVVQAQVYQPSNRIPVADNTLGTQVVGSNNNFAIAGGVSRGQNTFHSFQDFSVPTNGVATFANPAGNQSIITRVTGNLFSDINGTINTQGANFLLINPNGVVFGPGTQLNVGKAFTASTASGVDLVDGAGKTLNFGVNGAGDGALLSIDPKVVFNVSRFNMGGGSGEIKNFGTLQTNNPNQYIGLVGGNIAINGGQINAPGGKVELGGLSEPGSVELNTVNGNPGLSFPTNVESQVKRSNLSLTNQAKVVVSGAGGGEIVANAHNIDIIGSSISGGIARNTGTRESIAGDIQLNATGSIVLDSGSQIGNVVRVNSKGTGGNINLRASSLKLGNQSVIAAGTLGQGNAGNLIFNIDDTFSLDKSSSIINSVNAGAVGNSGNVDIKANSFSLQNQSRINLLTSGKGDAGTLNLQTKNALSLAGNSSISNLVDSGAFGNGGNIFIATGSLISQDSFILAATSGKGNAGNLILNAEGDISLKNNIISSAVYTSATGRGGDISFTANSIYLDGSLTGSLAFGKGDAGNISLAAKNNISLVNNSFLRSGTRTGAIGKGGDTKLASESISLSDSRISSSVGGQGDSGNVLVKANSVILSNSSIANDISIGATGKGGDIDISSDSLLLKDKSLLSTSLAGQGNGGGIFLNTKDTFTINNSFVGTGVAEGGIGDSGSIKINAGSISANEGSFSSVTHGKGNAGEIIIRAKNSISLADGFSVSGSVFPGGSGNAGNIDISSDSFSITSGAMLSSGVFSANQTLPPGKGNSGNINVSTTGNINISGLHSQITNNLDEGAQGKTGDITISGGSFSLNDNARISTSTFGKGNAGNIKLKIKDNVTVSGSLGIFSEVGKSGMGNAGNIDIEANALFLNNDSSILARVLGKGDAGNINLKIIKDINIIGSGNIGDSSRVASDVALGAEGRGGEISINTDSIYLRDNAFISTLNAGNGNGGNVFLTAKNNVHLMNNAAIATAAISKEEASAGNIYIDAKKLVLKQGAALSTEALGRGLAGNIIINASDSINISGEGSNLTQLSGISSQSIAGIAGDIILTTPILSLDNKAFINAQSNSGNGGNIRIGSIFSDSTAADTNFLFLRRGSQITTDAGGALDSSNGGNIAIKANFILAVPSEDSDISANAVKGRGGNVNINSQGLFGIQFRSQLSNSSDITASSSFGQNGNVNINTLGIDPGKNTSKLPSTPIDANRQISQTCNPSQVGEKFYVTGRGGHPANSEDYLSQEVVWLDLRSLKTSSIPSNLSIQSTKKIPQPAIGWAFNGQGKVTLVAANNESEVITNKVICPTINR